MITLNHPQGSENWLNARCGVITASRFTDARKKLSKASGDRKAGDPHGDAVRYAWTVAVETIARQPLDDTFVNYAMRRGRDLEPQARAVYEARCNAWIEEVSLVLTDDQRFGYSADGFRDDDGLIEIKCPLSAEKIGEVWAHPERAHLEYLDQINGGLWITGRKYCDLIVYCPWLTPVGKDLFVKRIHRDEAAIEALESDLVSFMKLVDANLEVLRSPALMSGRSKDESPIKPAEPPPWGDAATPPTAKPITALPETIF